MATAKEINTKLITARKGKISPKVRKNAMAILPVYMMLAFDCTQLLWSFPKNNPSPDKMIKTISETFSSPSACLVRS